MINFTPLVRSRFLSRLNDHQRFVEHPESVQQEQLVGLIEKASLTVWGRKYDYSTLRTYREFASRVPLSDYSALRPLVMRMVEGEAGVLWPGVTRHFAQSSGTSDGKSKYIPITAEALARNHYQGASDVVSHYLNLNPASRLFAGKALILGGSFANELAPKRGVNVGDLSATLIQQMNPLANLFRIPDKRTALMSDWTKKLPAIAQAAAAEKNITNLSGVPSWFLTVLKEVLAITGAGCLHDVWPGLEVFFHGGIDFEPYRAQYERLCDMSRMHFLNTYNASEGFFATQSDWSTTAMLLLLDVGVFYEFIPLAESASDNPQARPLWEVSQGETYELVITACNGLWRYRIGDTVTIESVKPLKISIAGRTKCFINAFGEELMVHNSDRAIAAVSREMGCEVLNYTAAPVFATDRQKARHQWLVEFATPPDSLTDFARELDKQLRLLNSDYDAKRSGDIFLGMPQVECAAKGLFDRWLAKHGKLGGQRKVPRLNNNADTLNELLEMNKQP